LPIGKFSPYCSSLLPPLWLLHRINRQMPPNKADMVAVWKGAQAAFHGQNPYSASTTRDIQIFYYGRPLTPDDHVNPMGFAYPMHTILLFAPIAPLPWPVVRLGFLILLPILVAASVVLWLRVAGLHLSRGSLAVTVILCLCSWQSMWAIHQIQPTIVVAVLAAAGCFFLQRGNAATAGVLLALATIKPQLIGILVLWLLLWAFLRGIWRLFVSFALTLSVLLACATWLLPNWVTNWRTASADYAVYRHLQLDLQLAFGHAAGLVCASVIAVVMLAILWQNRRCEPHSPEFGSMCALCLALTLCVLPTERAMTYNYILLFPACLILIHAAPGNYYAALARRIALGLIVWSYLIVPLAGVLDFLLGPSDRWEGLPFETLLIPAVVLIALIAPILASTTVPAQPA
jgi:hypothetical protein